MLFTISRTPPTLPLFFTFSSIRISALSQIYKLMPVNKNNIRGIIYEGSVHLLFHWNHNTVKSYGVGPEWYLSIICFESLLLVLIHSCREKLLDIFRILV